MPWELPPAIDCHLPQLHRPGAQEEVGIGGVDSKCQFASVVVGTSLTAQGASVGFALPRNEIHLAACHTSHLHESDELEAPVAALRSNRLGSPECTGEMADHTQALVSCCNKDAVQAEAYALCPGSLTAHKKVRGSVTWVGTNVLHTDGQRLSVAEAVVVGRIRKIGESAVSARSVKWCSAF